jgi:ornithine--oxo-acid transaminase
MERDIISLKSDRDIISLMGEREAGRYDLHSRYLNEQMVRVLKTIGFNVRFQFGNGQYLYDLQGSQYLDALSGFGVFAVGRNHPHVRDRLKQVLDADLPNLVQMDVSPMAGVLAERLLGYTPYLDKVFFANSGAETVEAAIKFARASTGRPGIIYCSHAFHGLTYGALSLNGDQMFRENLGPFLPDCFEVPFNDLEALDRALARTRAAAFIVEPIQGKGVNLPGDGYLRGAMELCRKHKALFIADEIQTGLGRTGRFLAVEHWGVEPDMVLLSKALSGGQVPVGALLTRKWIFDRLFDRMDRAVVHGSTFSKNDLAMTAAMATLDIIEAERLVENAARLGERLLGTLAPMADKYELVKDVRGKGLMIGIEFGPPRSLHLKAAWSALDMVNRGLFCQLIVIPLFKEHRILSQVAGHGIYTVKLLPPLMISEADCQWVEKAFDAVIADAHRVPGAVWSLGRTLAENAMRARTTR